MTERILKILYDNIGAFVSGEQIGNILSVSRVAVSKNIQILKNLGYPIISGTKNGHCLKELPDILDGMILSAITGKKTVFLPQCNSTNIIARELASSQDCELVAAAIQSDGRGRRGRNFSSEYGGIYFSYITGPALKPSQSMLINLAAGAAVFDVLAELGIEPFLKYPNDLYINGKKICGILTETLSDSDTLVWGVTGIGLNVNNELPQNLRDTATTLRKLTNKNYNLALLIQKILVKFDYFLSLKAEGIVTEYKKRCAMLRQGITIYNDDGTSYSAVAQDIDEFGHLRILRGEQSVLAVSGEVSLRLKKQ